MHPQVQRLQGKECILVVMKKSIAISLGIFLSLAASRFVPHPPNFTSLIALSFYVPAIFGLRYIPITVLALVITDIIIGFHSIVLFTWGSVILIGFISKYFTTSILKRLGGALSGACIFFIVTNLGAWLTLDMYEKNISRDLSGYISMKMVFIHTELPIYNTPT